MKWPEAFVIAVLVAAMLVLVAIGEKTIAGWALLGIVVVIFTFAS